MLKINLCIVIFYLFFAAVYAYAECPLDHFIIGINEDGIQGTDDDNKLFVDCRQKYRSSGTPSYVNWYYPLARSIFPTYQWRIGEPGFDGFQDSNPDANYTYQPDKSPAGIPDQDYRIIIQCISISPGLRAVHKYYPEFTIDQAGQSFNHSEIYALRSDAHMHMSYQAVDGSSLFWITWQIEDALGQYDSSKPFTIVFNTEPAAGDLAVNGKIDADDLAEFACYWLRDEGSIYNDYYERADINRDGYVNLPDLAALASNWFNGL
jgi:hypothetical protein